MSQRVHSGLKEGVVAGWAGHALVAIVLLAMAWLVLASTPLQALSSTFPVTRATVERTNDTLKREVLKNNGKAGEFTRTYARMLLHKDPLNASALTFMALAAERDGKSGDAAKLMHESLRRDPRSTGARAWFVYRAVQQDKVDEALSGTERLLALSPDAMSVAMQIFVYFSERPEAQQRLLAMLKRQSGWHDPFLGQLAAAKVSPETLARLASATAKGGGDQGRAAILSTLIQRGEARKAFALWQENLPSAAKRAEALVYDGGFKKLPGIAPFNWQFKSGEEGSAEIDGDRGLAVDYFGKGNTVLAEQALLLPPATYTLRVRIQSASLNSESMVWTVSCPRASRPLGEVKMMFAQGAELTLVQGQFIVPAWCDTQMLKLEGHSAEFPAAVNATVRSVEITRSKSASTVQAPPAS
jgi:tetratricopeptide (TPR) repeat protein